MTDNPENTVEAQQENPSQVTMAEIEETKPEGESLPPQQHEIKKQEKTMNTVTFSIWPPSQRTRDAVIKRLIETLSTPSVLSKRYGSMPADEANATARTIEEEAFAAAGGSASAEDDGIETLQVYSKEISKRMLEAVKSRSSSGSTPDNSSGTPVAASTISEEISTVNTESS